ncbi:uncharacterized protein PRCAT00004368001 [Priceomyces carsonii]|uniref:uncharacterized protein n=1 Tax=Priceomyces carsonii TaxID=28549 RepID=UPI002ED81264|nr:unnamed protein product [Priceomyces carsonii]
MSGIDPRRYENLPKNNSNKVESVIEPSNITKFPTASSSFGANNENVSDSFINRPATALLKVIDKFSAFSGLSNSNNSGSTWNKVNQSIGNNNKDIKAGSIMAHQLQAKVDKLVRVENKRIALQSDIANDLISWAVEIPNADCETMVKEFSYLFGTQCESSVPLIDKLEKLKLSFKFVNQREKKLRDLVNAKAKIIKALRENEIKYGPNASSTTLLNEKLEEIVWNLDVLEQQYIRAISKDLKESLVDFAVALQSTSTKLNDATSEYYNCLFSLEANAEYQRVSPKKYYNQSGNGLKVASASLFNGMNKSAVDSENSSAFKKEHEPNGGSSPIKLSSNRGPFEGKDISSLCAECVKSNRKSRLITPCTHSNAQNSDSDSLKHTNIDASPVKIGQTDPSVLGFRFREPSFQQSEQWN